MTSANTTADSSSDIPQSKEEIIAELLRLGHDIGEAAQATERINEQFKPVAYETSTAGRVHDFHGISGKCQLAHTVDAKAILLRVNDPCNIWLLATGTYATESGNATRLREVVQLRRLSLEVIDEAVLRELLVHVRSSHSVL